MTGLGADARRPTTCAADRHGQALARGYSRWRGATGVVWQRAAILVSLTLTPVMSPHAMGEAHRRWLGMIRVTAMVLTAALPFPVRTSHPGGFSVIHTLSRYVLAAAPTMWWTLRTGSPRIAGSGAAW